MIQLITENNNLKEQAKNNSEFKVNCLKNIESMDEYDINIIDLNSENLWYNKEVNQESINEINDLKHLKNTIENSLSSKMLIILPQNLNYFWHKYNNKYLNEEQLKNEVKLIKKIINENIYCFPFDLYYEKSITQIGDKRISSDFCFNNKQIVDTKWTICKVTEILSSNKSKKINTIKVDDKIYITSLNINENIDLIIEFLKYIKIYNANEEIIPKWIKDINILNDIEIKKQLSQIEENILKLEQNKVHIKEAIHENNKIKSILYETDKKLQNKIIEILNEMLDYNDDNFIDEMEEDFRIKKENITFIVETKGLKRNIAGTDVSKTFNHVLMYEEKLQEIGEKENVKGIFIVATQRDRCLQEREKTPDRQISIAERNNILIIRTEELLKLFEAFRNKKIKTEKIIKLFNEQIGEFKYGEE